jgi:hypothetical protein
MGGNEPKAYYKKIADAGYHAAGGESEQNAEMHAIMDSLIFGDFGGEGLRPLSNIFYKDDWNGPLGHETARGHGISAWLETYKADVQLYPDEVVESAIIAKKQGCKEVGFMIGWWMPVTSAPYIAMARKMEKSGYQCDGFNIWLGHGSSMWANYQKWAGVFKELMAIWPPNMTPMKQRFAGVTPTPPTPKPTTITPTSSTSMAGNYTFVRGSDYSLWYTPGVGWKSLGGILTSAPAAVETPTTIDVFARGANGALYYIELSKPSGQWGNWTSLGGYMFEGTGPSVKWTGEMLIPKIIVQVIGKKHEIYERGITESEGWIKIYDPVIASI